MVARFRPKVYAGVEPMRRRRVVALADIGPMTVAELTATMEGFYAAFPDLEYEVVQYTLDGDRLVMEYTYTGTHLGPIFGLAATGTVVQGRGLEIHTLAPDGRIAATHNYSDIFLLYVQLGLI